MRKILIIVYLLLTIKSQCQLNYAPYTNLWTYSWPEVIRIADINHDGLNDVILGLNSLNQTYHPNNYSILIFYQNQYGTLNNPVQYSFNDNWKDIISIDIGDLNQDGLDDILIGLESSTLGSKYGIFFQNTDHTFASLVSYPVNERLECARIGDINNDGINDMVISIYNTLIIRNQTSPGVFNQNSISKNFRASEMKISDVNNDGLKDIVILWSNYWRIYTFYQQNGTFSNLPNLETLLGEWYDDMAIDDLNNDGQNDIVLTRPVNYNSKIRIHYLNNGVHSNPISLNAYDLPEPVEIADLNNDGKKDIITAHGGWENLSTYTQNNTGDFSTYQLFPLPYATTYNFDALSVGDINNDGKKDIVTANYNRGVDILYNTSVLSTNESSLPFLRIYPNPTSDKLYIKNNNLFKDYEILDSSGRIILKGHIKNEFINTSNLSNGKYILILYDKSNDSRIAKSFIKK